MHERLPEANRRRIDQFLASPRQTLDGQTVAEFLAKAEIKVDPIEVNLAAQGLMGWNVQHGWRWMFGSGRFSGGDLPGPVAAGAREPPLADQEGPPRRGAGAS